MSRARSLAVKRFFTKNSDSVRLLATTSVLSPLYHDLEIGISPEDFLHCCNLGLGAPVLVLMTLPQVLPIARSIDLLQRQDKYTYMTTGYQSFQ